MYTALIIIGLIALIIAAILVYASTKPGTFRVERQTVINAPADKVYPLIADFHAWTAWSPFEGLDPNLKRTYSGPDSGLGATYEWSGNGRAGAGRMEIVEATAPSRVLIKLDFLKPFEAHNMADFILTPAGDGTAVSWAMYGPQPFVGKLMAVFMSQDAMIGGMFASGLAKLKSVAES